MECTGAKELFSMSAAGAARAASAAALRLFCGADGKDGPCGEGEQDQNGSHVRSLLSLR